MTMTRSGLGAAGLGQDAVPAVEGVVADLAPVDRDEDDRRGRPGGRSRAPRADRRPLGEPGAAHHAVAERGRDVGGEGGEAEGGAGESASTMFVSSSASVAANHNGFSRFILFSIE